jgi:uncharacterized protein YkwD
MKKLLIVFSLASINMLLSQNNVNVITKQQHLDAKSKASSTFDYKSYESKVIDRINEYRKSKGLKVLEFDSTLYLAADYQAVYMAENDTVTHYPEIPGMEYPGLRVKFFGKQYKILGECVTNSSLYLNFLNNIFHDNSIFELWKNSKPHNNILLRNDVTKISVAIGRKGNSDYLFACLLVSN